ncbi:AAA family ATPase [Ramlibacter sp.]|uniref:bifunctional aminoglycoside phosphotransferase/ATP-binding protein n=1 Tax=Ramlibacter sp. TaxID=1917967 RepID=UPI0035AE783E
MTPEASAHMVHALAAQRGARVIETHISWVLLTADRAWKLKKPLHLPFLDHRTLAARQFSCAEELRLNGRLAPGLYLGVDAITGTPEAPVIGGAGEPIDYAVRMWRFADGALFSERVEAGTLQAPAVDALAQLLADFHAQAPTADPAMGFGTPEQRREAALAAAAGAAQRMEEPLPDLQAWIDHEADRLTPLWTERLAQGHVREGHGDLHLANIVLLEDGDAQRPSTVAAFDGIEFAPALRWIDVLDDLAFAVMDFAARGRRDFAFRLLNGWLDRTGDHAALPALRMACVYRALVRAHVHALRGAREPARHYVAQARAWSAEGEPRLCITHGLPASGKSVRSLDWLQTHGGIRLRSDVERKRLFGLPMLASTHAAAVDAYTAEASQRTYARLLDQARIALQAGFPVVLDAAYLRRDERDAARALARVLGVPFAILDCAAPMAVLRDRIAARRGDASEANLEVLERLATVAEPLTADERGCIEG